MEIVITTNHVAYLRNSEVFYPTVNPFIAATYSTVRVTSTIWFERGSPVAAVTAKTVIVAL